MHKRSHTLKVTTARNKVKIGEKEIDITGVRPIELLLAALAYGVGIRYIDKTGREFEMECEIDNYEIICKAKCSGEEEKCLVFRTVKKGIKFYCIDEQPPQS